MVGDLSSIAETRRLAEQVNDLGRYHAVIHNAERLGTSPATGLVLPKHLDSLPVKGNAALLMRLEVSLSPAIHALVDRAPQPHHRST